jgi:Holliday junction DNA helicase RuvA
MYEAIRGILKDKDPAKAVVEAGGISYRLTIPLSTYTNLPLIESPVYLFLSEVVREDAHTLYAFLEKEERDLFEILIALSGIGPKTAVAIIGHIDICSFQQAIAAADVRLLSKIPGIGKKTAERLVIEMKDKIKNKGKGFSCSSASLGSGVIADAIHALMNLGYHSVDAQKAVQKVLQEKKDETDLGSLITAALQHI